MKVIGFVLLGICSLLLKFPFIKAYPILTKINLALTKPKQLTNPNQVINPYKPTNPNLPTNQQTVNKRTYDFPPQKKTVGKNCSDEFHLLLLRM